MKNRLFDTGTTRKGLLGLFVLLALGGLLVFGCTAPADAGATNNETQGGDAATVGESGATAGDAMEGDTMTGDATTGDATDPQGDTMEGDAMENKTVTFTLTGENFKFVMDGVDNPELRVNEGDTVRIEFTSTSGFHDWVLDEFDAKTEQVNAPESTFVEFVADQKGTFEYYCSVGQHRANGMKGVFVVE